MLSAKTPFHSTVFMALLAMLVAPAALAVELEVLHADSLAGPMRALKTAFETKNSGVTLKLTSGVSRDLAKRVLGGDACDVFAPSSPAVIDEDLMGKKIAGSEKDAATWYVVFSANEMVVITAKGNPLGIRQVSDLARPQMKFARVTGERDLATGRTLEFIKRAVAQEGKPELAQKIVDSAPADPAKPTTVPETVSAVKEGRANAGVVYYSAAIAARNDVDIVRFPDSVNLSEAIRNAATVPGTARSPSEATAFVAFLLTPEAQAILKDTGQPPVAPAIRKGAVPALNRRSRQRIDRRIEGIDELAADRIAHPFVAVEQHCPVEAVAARARAGERAGHVADARGPRHPRAAVPRGVMGDRADDRRR
jgi:molybdate transport system substrate-binding protein